MTVEHVASTRHFDAVRLVLDVPLQVRNRRRYLAEDVWHWYAALVWEFNGADFQLFHF
jgi:hypothetical protein